MSQLTAQRRFINTDFEGRAYTATYDQVADTSVLCEACKEDTAVDESGRDGPGSRAPTCLV